MPKPSPEVGVRTDGERRDGRIHTQATWGPLPAVWHSTRSRGPGTGYAGAPAGSEVGEVGGRGSRKGFCKSCLKLRLYLVLRAMGSHEKVLSKRVT